jgi:hypothetical protein
VARIPRGARTIEQHLANEPRRHPAEAGFELIVALNERQTNDLLCHAVQVDADLRDSLRRVRNKR